MKSRTTLSLDTSLQERGKRIALLRGTSLTGLIEDYLRSEEDPAGSMADSLVGSARLKTFEKGSDPRWERLSRKYSANEDLD